MKPILQHEPLNEPSNHDLEVLDIVLQSQTSNFVREQAEMEYDCSQKSRSNRLEDQSGREEEDDTKIYKTNIADSTRRSTTHMTSHQTVPSAELVVKTQQPSGLHVIDDIESQQSSAELLEPKVALPLTQLRSSQAPYNSTASPGAYSNGRNRLAQFHSWMLQEPIEDSPSPPPTSPPPPPTPPPPSSSPPENAGQPQRSESTTASDLVVTKPVTDLLETQQKLPKAVGGRIIEYLDSQESCKSKENVQELPLTQLTTGEDIATTSRGPGAYLDGRQPTARFHSSMILKPHHDDCTPSPSVLPHSEGATEDNKSANLVVANPITDQGNEKKELPKAQELDVSQREINQRQRKLTTTRIFIAALAAATLLILLLVFLIAEDASSPTTELPSNSNSNSNSPSTSPTQAPSSFSMPSHMLDLLPEDTLLALDNVGSYQSRAYDWMIADPNLTNYSDTRILQRFALASLYFATDGAHWTNNSNWLSYDHHECAWHVPNLLKAIAAGYIGDKYFAKNNPGVQSLRNDTFPCSPASSSSSPDADEEKEDQLYTHLWALSNNLRGQIPPEMFLLTNLKTIVFLANPLQEATLATQIGRLTSLESLGIVYGKVAGTIPTQIGLLSNLHSLYLFGNQLEGGIPSELGLLSDNLSADLDLAGNKLNGTLPTQLGHLSTLDRLLLFNNQLSGSIPSEIGVMEGLKRLTLRQNRLTGPLPWQLAALPSLDRILLYDNELSGPIPTQLGIMEALKVILLSNNQLSGTLPSQLALLTNLGRMSLSQNQISGTIPTELSLLATNGSLFDFDLSDNTLSGKVSHDFCNIGVNVTCPVFPYLPDYQCAMHFDCSADLCGCDCPCH